MKILKKTSWSPGANVIIASKNLYIYNLEYQWRLYELDVILLIQSFL